MDPKVVLLNTVVSGYYSANFHSSFRQGWRGGVDLPRRRRHHSARNSEEWEARGGLFAWMGGEGEDVDGGLSVTINGLLAVQFHSC